MRRCGHRRRHERSANIPVVPAKRVPGSVHPPQGSIQPKGGVIDFTGKALLLDSDGRQCAPQLFARWGMQSPLPANAD